MPVVIEIVARLGATVIDFAHVPPGARYRIADRTFIAKPGTHEVGLVAITMERMFRVEQPLARRRPQARPLVYGAASLALHGAIILIAFLTEPFEQMLSRFEMRPRLMVRIEEELPPAKRTAAAQPAATTPTGRRPPQKRQARVAYSAESVAQAMNKAISRVGVPSEAMAHAFDDAAPVYNEDDANQKDFGNHLWDIDNDPDFATVKTPEGYDLGDLSGYADLYDLGDEASKEARKAANTKRRFEMQVALAHKSAARGDCCPAHRIAKWLEKLDKNLFVSMYLADDAIVTCLRQEVDPRVQWHGKLPN